MTTEETAAPGFPHLFGAVVACLVTAVGLAAGRGVAIYLEHKEIHAIAPLLFKTKDQGSAFQRAAAADPAILPLYGSSELVKGSENKASEYFRDAPTGFQVSPVGEAGTTSITLAQRLVCILPQLAGRKIVISLSPSWFLRQRVDPHFYAGNFSPMEAHEVIFGRGLSDELKKAFATHMLQFPETLSDHSVLHAGARAAASGGWASRLVYGCIWPLGRLHELIFDLQDHFEALVRIRSVMARSSHSESSDHSSKANEGPTDTALGNEPQAVTLDDSLRAGGDAVFLARINTSAEWADFELLLRLLKEAKVKPLILCIPMDGLSYGEVGISKEARQQFYTKLESLTKNYGFPLLDFSDHDEDPTFLEAHRYHLTAAGWSLYDRALDDFYHDRSLGQDIAAR